VIRYRNKKPAEERHAQYKKKIDAKTKKNKKTTGERAESRISISIGINYYVIRCLEYPLRIIPALFFSHWIITASLTFFHSFLRTAGPPLRPLLQLASRDRHFIVLANF